VIVASLATVQGREVQIRKTVESLLPQVDLISVCLNNTPTPEYFSSSPKIISVQSDNSLGDGGKFLLPDGLRSKDFYHIVCDDDIIYKKGWVQFTIDGIEKYNRLAVVSTHGKDVVKKVKNFHRDILKVAHCRFSLEKDVSCHIPGTGVLAYHTDTIRIPISIFKHPNMADIWVGHYLQTKDIPVVCLKHHNKVIEVQRVEKTIFNTRDKVREIKQRDVVNSIKWKRHEKTSIN